MDFQIEILHALCENGIIHNRMRGMIDMKQMKTISIILGILTGILGACAVAMPFRTFLGIGWVVGMLFLFNGVEMLATGLAAKKKDVWQVIFGICVVILGLVILFSGWQRFLTDVMFVYLIGGSILMHGIYQLIIGFKVWGESKGRAIAGIILGIISMIAAMFAMAHPIMTMFTLGYIIGFALIFQGIDTIVMGVTLQVEE